MAHPYPHPHPHPHHRSHHGGSHPPPLFVAELEAPNVRPPPRQPAVNSTDGPIFEMSADSAIVVSKDEQNRPGARPASHEAPAQANPWPFYLEESGRSPLSPTWSGVGAEAGNARPATANPWPYHGPGGDDEESAVTETSERRDEVVQRTGHDPHVAAEGSEQQSPPTTAYPPRPDNGTPGLDRTNTEPPKSASPAHLYPAPLNIKRSSQPPSPHFKPYSPTPMDHPAPPPAAASPALQANSPAGDAVTISYRPYRPPGTPIESPPISPLPMVEQPLGRKPSPPYPTDSPPLRAYTPQSPVPYQPPLPPGIAVARRSTQPIGVTSPRLPLDPSFTRSQSLSMASHSVSPQSPRADQSLASPLVMSPAMPPCRPPKSSPTPSQQSFPGPNSALPSPGFAAPSPVSSYAGASPTQSMGHSAPQTPANAAVPLYNLPQSNQGYSSPAVTEPLTRLQTQDPVPPQPHRLQQYAQVRPEPSASQPPPLPPPPPAAAAAAAPPPPPQPPRPPVKHANSDPTSPSYASPQSPPPPYTYIAQEASPQPTPAIPGSPYQGQPPQGQPSPQSLYHGQYPGSPQQNNYQQPQPPIAHPGPPLPPRPVSTFPAATPGGFSPGIPSTASFPPPPKTQYMPPPQRPSSTKLFSSSSAKKWLDKTNQVLEGKLVPILQAQAGARLPPGLIQGCPTLSQQQHTHQPPAPGQHYYPYAIREDPSGRGQQPGYRGPPGR